MTVDGEKCPAADVMHRAGRHDDHDWMVIPSVFPMSKSHRALLFRQDADNLLAFRHNGPGPNSQLILTDLARNVGERKDLASKLAINRHKMPGAERKRKQSSWCANSRFSRPIG